MAQPHVDELPLGHDTPPHLKAPQESSPKESVHMATCRGLQSGFWGFPSVFFLSEEFGGQTIQTVVTVVQCLWHSTDLHPAELLLHVLTSVKPCETLNQPWRWPEISTILFAEAVDDPRFTLSFISYHQLTFQIADPVEFDCTICTRASKSGVDQLANLLHDAPFALGQHLVTGDPRHWPYPWVSVVGVQIQKAISVWYRSSWLSKTFKILQVPIPKSQYISIFFKIFFKIYSNSQ